jgi:hypothetical protein
MITGAILLFSGMLIFLVLAIVYSKGEVFSHKSFYIVGTIIFVLALASFRFPKQIGLPFIIVAGFLVTAFAFLFLRFPLADELDPLVLRSDNLNAASVRIMRPSDVDFSREFASFQLINTEDPLSVDIYEFHLDEALPLAGGQVRSSPARIMQNGIVIMSNPMILRMPFINFITITEYQRDIFIEDL